MNTKNEILKNLTALNAKYKNSGFKIFSLFGSYARGNQDSFSDIDLTYSIDHELFFKDNAFAKLAKIEEIKNELEKEFHTKVDLIPSNTKNMLIQKSLKEEQILV
ncbi:MAG: nucleotidyltransferase family protein [Arcobacter sp.]